MGTSQTEPGIWSEHPVPGFAFSGLAVMKRAGHSDFRVTQEFMDLAGVEFAEETERAVARAFAHVPRKPLESAS